MAVSIVAVSAAMWQFSLSVAGDGKVVAGDGNSVCLVVVLVVILVAIVIILYCIVLEYSSTRVLEYYNMITKRHTQMHTSATEGG